MKYPGSLAAALHLKSPNHFLVACVADFLDADLISSWDCVNVQAKLVADECQALCKIGNHLLVLHPRGTSAKRSHAVFPIGNLASDPPQPRDDLLEIPSWIRQFDQIQVRYQEIPWILDQAS